MTRIEFISECEKRNILPDIALENDDIRQALKERKDGRVRYLLNHNF